MGCDGRIVDKSQPLRIRVTCYRCGKRMDEIAMRGLFPNEHDGCIDDDTRLAVNLEISNYEPR